MKSYRCSVPKPDKQGRVRAVVGGTRFQIGNVRDTTQSEVSKRLEAIRDLYDRQCSELGIDFWANWTLPWAHKLAQGTPAKAHFTDYAKANPGQAAEELSLIYKLQSWGCPVQIVEPETQQTGEGFLRKQIEDEVTKAVRRTMESLGIDWGQDAVEAVTNAVPEDFANAETKTLHEAINAYSETLREESKRDSDGNLVARTRKCMDRLKYLKQAQEDMPLWRFRLPEISQMAAHWRNRPLTRKKTRCSKDHARDMCKELFRFLGWLDTDPSFRWSEPKGIEKISRSPIPLDEDKSDDVFQTTKKQTYTPKELATLVRHADPLGRAIIGVCVNCAFGASEIGQWPTKKMVIERKHPHAEDIGYETTKADSWIVGERPKTGVYGEHLLWPEVAVVLMPFLDGRKFLPITSVGTPWYRRHSANPQTKFRNWWNNLLDKVQETEPGFRRLPFGSLRDTLPNELRKQISDDLASIALQHGSFGEDQLLECYANIPFARFFAATKAMEDYYRSLLDALVDDSEVTQEDP